MAVAAAGASGARATDADAVVARSFRHAPPKAWWLVGREGWPAVRVAPECMPMPWARVNRALG